MGVISNVKKVCSFYVSSMHLITMIMPHLRKQIEVDAGISTFFEYNLEETANTVISKIILADDKKEIISDLEWNSKNGYKFSHVEKEIKEALSEFKELNILVMGNANYIKAVNENVEVFLEKNARKISKKYISIINCYEVGEFNENIKDILDEHDYILNTSGMKEIEEVFEGYKKA